MSLSLQAGKPINSENTGLYKEFSMPFGKNESEINIKIHYTDEGKGEPLFLVHSFGQSLYTWSSIVSELGARYRVIAVDLLGHGYSDTPQYCDFSVKQQAEVLAELMRKMSIDSANFMGFSLGCGVVASFAAEHPIRVKKIMMLSPGGITPYMPPLLRMINTPIVSAVAAMFVTKNAVQAMLNECFLDLTRIDDRMISQYWSTLESPDNKRAARLFAASFNEGEFIEDLKKLSIPIHFIMSSDDKWHTAEDAQEYFAAVVNGTSGVIRNAGHLMQEEQPQKILAAVFDFFGVGEQEQQEEEI